MNKEKKMFVDLEDMMNTAIKDGVYEEKSQIPLINKIGFIEHMIGTLNIPDNYEMLISLHIKKIIDIYLRGKRINNGYAVSASFDPFKDYGATIPFGAVLVAYMESKDGEKPNRLMTAHDIDTENRLNKFTYLLIERLCKALDLYDDISDPSVTMKPISDINYVYKIAANISKITTDESIIDALEDYINDPSVENLSNLHFNKWINDMPEYLDITELQLKKPEMVDQISSVFESGNSQNTIKLIGMLRKADIYEPMSRFDIIILRLKRYTRSIYDLMIILKALGKLDKIEQHAPTLGFNDICITGEEYHETRLITAYKDLELIFLTKLRMHEKRKMDVVKTDMGMIAFSSKGSLIMPGYDKNGINAFGDNVVSVVPMSESFTRKSRFYYDEALSMDYKNLFDTNDIDIHLENIKDEALKVKYGLTYKAICPSLIDLLPIKEFKTAFIRFMNDPTKENLSVLHPNKWFSNKNNIRQYVVEDELMGVGIFTLKEATEIAGEMYTEDLFKYELSKDNKISSYLREEIKKHAKEIGLYKQEVLLFRVNLYVTGISILIEILKATGQLKFDIKDIVSNKSGTDICMTEEDYKEVRDDE